MDYFPSSPFTYRTRDYRSSFSSSFTSRSSGDSVEIFDVSTEEEAPPDLHRPLLSSDHYQVLYSATSDDSDAISYSRFDDFPHTDQSTRTTRRDDFSDFTTTTLDEDETTTIPSPSPSPSPLSLPFVERDSLVLIFVGLFLGGVVACSFVPMLFLYSEERDWSQSGFGAYSFFGFVVALSLALPVLGIPLFQFLSRKIMVHWILVCIAFVCVVGNGLMLVENRFLFLFGYAISKAPIAYRDLITDVLSVQYCPTKGTTVGIVFVCFLASGFAVIFPIISYLLQQNDLLSTNKSAIINEYTLIPLINIFLVIISGILLWFARPLRYRLQVPESHSSLDEYRVPTDLDPTETAEFIANVKQRRKVLVSHHFFFLVFFGLEIFCVQFTVGLNLVLIQPVLVELFNFSLLGISVVTGFSSFLYFIPLFLSTLHTGTLVSSRVFLLLSLLCVLIGTFGMVFPHTSSNYCKGRSPDSRENGLWILQFFGSYCISLLGQAIFSGQSSKLYRTLMGDLVHDESDFAFLLKGDDALFYLRLIPAIGPALGAIVGAHFGLEKFGCSYLILFLIIPIVFGLVIFLLCFKYLKPLKFPNLNYPPMKRGKAGAFLTMDSIATVRSSTESISTPPQQVQSQGSETWDEEDVRRLVRRKPDLMMGNISDSEGHLSPALPVTPMSHRFPSSSSSSSSSPAAKSYSEEELGD